MENPSNLPTPQDEKPKEVSIPLDAFSAFFQEVNSQVLQPLIRVSKSETEAGERIAESELRFAERQLIRTHHLKLIAAIIGGISFLGIVTASIILVLSGREGVGLSILSTVIVGAGGYGFGRLHQRSIDDTDD